jgi:hypothetical protein
VTALTSVSLFQRRVAMPAPPPAWCGAGRAAAPAEASNKRCKPALQSTPMSWICAAPAATG